MGIKKIEIKINLTFLFAFQEEEAIGGANPEPNPDPSPWGSSESKLFCQSILFLYLLLIFILIISYYTSMYPLLITIILPPTQPGYTHGLLQMIQNKSEEFIMETHSNINCELKVFTIITTFFIVHTMTFYWNLTGGFIYQKSLKT